MAAVLPGPTTACAQNSVSSVPEPIASENSAGTNSAAPAPRPVRRAALLGPADAMKTFATVASWVERGAVGEELNEEGDAESRPGAAAVTLRRAGRIVGLGVSASTTAPVREAAGRAIRAMNQPGAQGHDLLQQSGTPARRDPVSVDLELAGPLVPVTVRTYDEADLRFEPGLDGVAVRVGDRVELVFPGFMLARDQSPGEGLGQAIAEATGDATLSLRGNPEGEPGALAKSHGLVVYTFRTTRVAHRGREQSASFLHRGGRLVDARVVTEPFLRAFAAQTARHLAGRRAGEGGAMLGGTPLPTLGRLESAAASERECALAALALARAARIVSDDVKPALRARAVELLRAIGPSTAGADAAAPVSAAALAWAAFMELAPETADEPARELSERCAERVRNAAAKIDEVPAPERAVIAFAAARGAAAARTPESIALARRCVGQVFSGTPQGELVRELPWLGWAERVVAKEIGSEQDGAAAAWRELRELVARHSVSADLAGPDGADLVGGVVFDGEARDLPTWHTARPAAFLASMLRDPALTAPDERTRELARILPAFRFLRQLAVDRYVAGMCADADSAMWGIRASVWDQRLPADAASMTLLAIVELVESLESGRDRAQNAEPR